MNLLSVELLSKSYGTKKLFKDISFGINKSERVGLIANNGAGKTTLLKILQGLEIADEGRVVFRKNLSISFLEQNVEFDAEKSVMEVVFNTITDVKSVIDQFNKYSELASENPNEFNLNQLDELTTKMTELNGWDYENKLQEILSRLKIKDTGQKIGELSGGQLKRVALAKILIQEPELLVLDEPTNHLDVEMIEWLENFILSRDMSLLLITHDRYFLNAVCNRIIELVSYRLYFYAGNFEYYLEKKAEREAVDASELEKIKNLYRRELEWVRKSPRARGTKQKARTDAFYKIEEKATVIRQETKINLEVKVSRLGGKILELINLKKSFGDKKILSEFSYTFKKGEKIGIVGKNGTGKTTLLKILLGSEKIDAGKIQTGETVAFGYYSQTGMVLKEDMRVIELVKDIAEFILMADGSKLSASQLLQRFNFSPDLQFGYVSKLSGGEKRRLYLMTILIRNPNFLILDEPTNDLDIATLQTLEEFLANYTGCVLIVSHDRYFMDKIVDHIFAFEGEGFIKDFPGSYSEYRDWREKNPMHESKISPVVEISESNDKAESIFPSQAQNNSVVTAKKRSYKEKLELEKLEIQIAKLETEKKELETGLAIESAHAQLMELTRRYAEVEKLLEECTLRWFELSDSV